MSKMLKSYQTHTNGLNNMNYLAGPASGHRRLRGAKSTKRAPFHAPPQVGKDIDTLHRVAHVGKRVKATRGACVWSRGGDGGVRGAMSSDARHASWRSVVFFSITVARLDFFQKKIYQHSTHVRIEKTKGQHVQYIYNLAMPHTDQPLCNGLRGFGAIHRVGKSRANVWPNKSKTRRI
jgi:hypothetical protein